MATVQLPASESSTALTLAGRFALAEGGRPVPVARSVQRLLARLALAAVPLHRSRLAGALWADVPQSRAASNLRTTLWRLPRLRSELVRVEADLLHLAREVYVDVAATEALARRCLRRPDDTTLAAVPELVAAADLLPDWDDDWVVTERERLRMLRLEALECVAEEFLARGAVVDALLTAAAAIEMEPLRESTRRIVVRAHLARGNVLEGLRCYRAYDDLIRREIGARPSPAMSRLVAPWCPAPVVAG